IHILKQILQTSAQDNPSAKSPLMMTASNTLFARTVLVVAAALLLREACNAAEITNTLKYEEPKHLIGTIYSADRKKALFRFSRVSVRHGNTLTVSRAYTDLEGN